MKVLITGSDGAIGNEIVNQLSFNKKYSLAKNRFEISFVENLKNNNSTVVTKYRINYLVHWMKINPEKLQINPEKTNISQPTSTLETGLATMDLEDEISKVCKTFSINNSKQEYNLINTLKSNCRKAFKEKTGKKPYTNVNLVRI